MVLYVLGAFIISFQLGNVAAAPDNKGTEFYLAFMANNRPTGGKEILFITSEHTTSVTVHAPHISYNRTLHLEPKQLVQFDFNSTMRLATKFSVTENKGILVRSEQEVVVYGINLLNKTTDAYLGLPADIQNLTYFLVTSGSLPMFAIVGIYDNTKIIIRFPHNRHREKTIRLSRLQTYQCIGRGREDFTGAKVMATKPISVFSGSLCSRIGQMGACDHLTEQIPPVTTWGEHFIMVSIANRTVGDIFRVVASQDDTKVNIFGGRSHRLTREGDFWEIDIPSATYWKLVCTKPCLLVQYNKGQNTDLLTDPFMLIIPPIEQYASNYVLATSQDTQGHPFHNFLSLVIEGRHADGIFLDGSRVNTTWHSIPNSTHVAMVLAIPPGGHTVHHQSPIVSFAAAVYGHRPYDSYGYPGGLRLAPIAMPCVTSATSPLDGVDNDCDGRIDEELSNDLDDDGDGLVDEDLAAREPVVAPRWIETITYSSPDIHIKGCYNNTENDCTIFLKVCNSLSQMDSLTSRCLTRPRIDIAPECRKLGQTKVTVTEQVKWQTSCLYQASQSWTIKDSCGHVVLYHQNVTYSVARMSAILTPFPEITCPIQADQSYIEQSIKEASPRIDTPVCQRASFTVSASISNKLTPTLIELSNNIDPHVICFQEITSHLRRWRLTDSCGRTKEIAQTITFLNPNIEMTSATIKPHSSTGKGTSGNIVKTTTVMGKNESTVATGNTQSDAGKNESTGDTQSDAGKNESTVTTGNTQSNAGQNESTISTGDIQSVASQTESIVGNTQHSFSRQTESIVAIGNAHSLASIGGQTGKNVTVSSQNTCRFYVGSPLFWLLLGVVLLLIILVILTTACICCKTYMNYKHKSYGRNVTFNPSYESTTEQVIPKAKDRGQHMTSSQPKRQHQTDVTSTEGDIRQHTFGIHDVQMTSSHTGLNQCRVAYQSLLHQNLLQSSNANIYEDMGYYDNKSSNFKVTLFIPPKSHTEHVENEQN